MTVLFMYVFSIASFNVLLTPVHVQCMLILPFFEKCSPSQTICKIEKDQPLAIRCTGILGRVMGGKIRSWNRLGPSMESSQLCPIRLISKNRCAGILDLSMGARNR
jgi:hypothetical protein